MRSRRITRAETISLPRGGVATGDLWGGLAAMLVALPSSIAFGVVIFTAAAPSLASAGALAGIVGAAVLGITAPLVGRNGGFITAPCAPAAAVLSGVAAALAAGGATPHPRIVLLLALTALVSACLQIAWGTLRFGRLIKYIPYQVVTGYLSGVAVIIALSQIPRLAGVPAAPLAEVLTSPRAWSLPALAVGVTTIVAMLVARKLVRTVPEAVIGLAAGIVAYGLLAALLPELRRLDGNALVVGRIPTAVHFVGDLVTRWRSLTLLGPSDLALVVGPALTLSVLLSIDTLKTGVVLDALTARRHDSNRELIAQGVANAASCLTGGVPGAGTMGPTLVNVTSGGRTPWSGVVSGVLIALAFLLLGSAIAWIPLAALAGVLVAVAWKMFDFGIFRLLASPSTRLDFLVIFSVITIAAAVGLIEAAVVGVCLAILLFMRNQIRGSVIAQRGDLCAIRSKRRRTARENTILDEHGAEALFVQLRGDLFFGTTDQLFQELEADLAARRFLLMDLRRVESMDYTAMHLLGQMQERLTGRGGMLLFSGIPSALPAHRDLVAYLSRLERDGSRIVFELRDAALEWMEDRVLEGAGWTSPASPAPLEFHELMICRLLDSPAIEALRACSEPRQFAAGERVFGVGDAEDEILFVRSGRVHILLPLAGGQRHHLATVCRGEFLGEMAFLDRAPRSAEAVAATETCLYALSRARFDALGESPGLEASFFRELALAIAHRLRVADAELRVLEER